jgi:N utilization substance protein A
MNAEFFNALEALIAEKGISREYMMEKIEAALTSAFRREVGGGDNVRIVLDPIKRDLKVIRLMTVVEEVTDPTSEMTQEQALAAKAQKRAKGRSTKVGAVMEITMDPKSFRRLSAGAAKQVIIQGIREAERTNMVREYESKKESVITALVDKIDPESGNVILNLGTGFATLPVSEQIPGEEFAVGDHVKVVLTEIHSGEARGPLVSISRSHPSLVRRLFELEIPEIADGTIEVKNVSREAGSRSKVAVFSTDPAVDPVGACIGKGGVRIAPILAELGGEKIDVIRYSEDPATYVAEALSPAKVISVEMENERTCRVRVDADQLSLAIGKEGQNAKLAARLTGFKIDIKA